MNNAKGIVFKFGDNVDTDVIIPARYLNSSDPAELATHCMEDIDKDFIKNVKKGDIIVAEKNFGCGSSREHAPIAIKAAGVSCVIAETFARIFYRNAINIGLPIIECSRICGTPGKKKKKNSPSRHQLPEQAVCTADQKTGQYIACHSHHKIPYCRDSAARFHHPCCNSDSDQGEQRTRQIPCKHGIQHRITGAERGCRKTPSSRGRSFQKKGGKAQNSIIQQKILCKEKIQKDLIVQKNTPCAFCMV